MAAWVWTSRDDGDASVTFAGRNQDALDAQDVSNELRALHNLTNAPRGSATAALIGVAFILVFFATDALTTWLQVSGAVQPLVCGTVPFLCAALAIAIAEKRAKPRRATFADHFTLSLTKTELTCEGATMQPVRVPLDRVAEVIGGSRLDILFADATTVRLPAVLPGANHAELAAEINAKVRELRARSMTYRGARVDVAEEPASAVNESDAEARKRLVSP